MCDPVSVGLAIAGAVASKAMAPKPPKMAEPPPPEKPPQAVKQPDQRAVRAAAATSGTMPGGPDTTLLTGQNGVAPSALNLGKSTLLGQ